jgi:hypothetical protein
MNVPFVSNTSDDTHCFQAGLYMLILYFWPDEKYTFEELDKISAKVEGLWTWPTAALLWLQNKGVEILIREVFDNKRFVDEGGDYLIEFYGSEVAHEQIKHSDIIQERRLMKQAIQKLKIQKKIPSIKDIAELLQKKYLICCNVNSKALSGKSGYVGHFVVVYGIDADKELLYMHDPGLPPRPNREVNFKDFERAWAYPNEKVKGLTAFRLASK